MPIPDCSYVDVEDEARPVGDDFAYCLAAEVRALKGRVPYVGSTPPSGSNRLWLDTNTGLWRIKFNDGNSDQWVSPKGDGAGSATGASGSVQYVAHSAGSYLPTGVTVAHGAASIPDQISYYLECTEQDGNFPIGHKIFPQFITASGTLFYISCDAANVYIQPSAVFSQIRARDPLTGSVANILLAKWRISVHATKFTN